MMKKLFLMAAAALTVGLCSCNEDLGPEYSTWPVISDFEVSPNVYPPQGEEKEAVEAGRNITMTGYATNKYGKFNVYLYYRTLSAEEAAKSTPKWSEWNKPSVMDRTLFVWETAPIEKMPFTLVLPAQKAGTTVEWRFGFANIYSLGADTGIQSFKVESDEPAEITPAPENPAEAE